MFQPHSHIFSVQKISLLALLTASCIVGRLFFVWIPNVQPMSAILFLLALAGSLSDALIVALLSLLGTNIYLGMGPWTISQFVALAAMITLILFPVFERMMPALNKWRK